MRLNIGTKKVVSLAVTAAMLLSFNALSAVSVYAAEIETSTNTDVHETGVYDFPETLPTANMPENLSDGVYNVPVYMYTRYTDEASMGNGAINHEATVEIKNSTATVHLGFHDMPFLDLYGHLENLWYYDEDGEKYEVTVDESEWLVNEDTLDRVKTIRLCSFVLPTTGAETVCRVKVDAMGDSEQDARLVFDWNNIQIVKSGIDTSALEAKIAEAEAIGNDENKYTAESYNALQEMIDTAKSALTAEDLTQEYADAFVGLIQNSIDGLEENKGNSKIDTSALEAKIAEAEAIGNDENKYTAESYKSLQEMIDTAKSALTAEDLTQEYADQFVELLQNAIDSLEENKNTSEIDITSLKNLISYANTLIQDDESYSQEGIEILKSEISSTEKLCESITTQDELSQAEWELVKAIGKLQSTAIANIDLEDGYYETSVSYYCAYYNHELQMYTLKDGTSEYELMKNILGSTIRFKVEDGVYTIMFEPQICEDSDWYYNSFSSNLGPCKDSEFNMTTQTIEYYDREINIINPEDYVMCRTMDQPYTYKSGKYIEMNGYCKSEETEYTKNITQIDFDDGTLPYWESAFIDIDWENAVKTADLVVDKSELAKELEFAEYMFTTDLSMYTDASVEDYKEAYDAAKAVYDNESVKQSEVKAAVQSLSDASYNLVKNDAYLTAKILEASAIEKDNLPDEKWTVLQTAIAEANSVLENENSTQAELKAQIENLSEAVAAVLSPNVDVAALEAKLSEAKAISNYDGKYTADSFAVLEQYIAIAEPAVTADDLTQETADQLVILLQSAIDGLIETTVSVDTSALEAKIAEAEAIGNDENKYTAESYKALQDMIDTAKSALTAEDLTQEYADAFVGLIQNSIDGLEENLPQTGNNSLFNLSVILGAFALIGAGLITMFKSGIVRRKKNC